MYELEEKREREETENGEVVRATIFGGGEQEMFPDSAHSSF
jgi:hypothetical protein